jgi:hypothetical protein
MDLWFGQVYESRFSPLRPQLLLPLCPAEPVRTSTGQVDLKRITRNELRESKS